jgi:hypothetical protein
MLDSDLAELYQVPTFRLNEQVKRNKVRFPEDFMFQLAAKEYESLRSQIAISKGRGARRYQTGFWNSRKNIRIMMFNLRLFSMQYEKSWLPLDHLRNVESGSDFSLT